MYLWPALILFPSLCAAAASRISEGTAQQLWQQAWATTLEQTGINPDAVGTMPEELQQHLQHKAKKIWKSLLQESRGSEPVSTTVDYDMPSTTVNYAMQRLLAGVEPGYAVPAEGPSFRQASVVKVETTSTTTTMSAATTSTEDPKVQIERQRQQQALLELRNSFAHKLTEGMGKIDEEEATATTTTTTTTTTTATVNPFKLKLLKGIDGPAPDASDEKQVTTTSTTSTTTTTQTIGEAGRKELAFLEAGAGQFVMPHHHGMDEQAPSEDDEEDDEKKASDDAEFGEGKVAAEFDMDNAS